MEESSVAFGSWNLCLTDGGLWDNFPAAQYGVPADLPFVVTFTQSQPALLKPVLLTRF
jgi:hypothetical protein